MQAVAQPGIQQTISQYGIEIYNPQRTAEFHETLENAGAGAHRTDPSALGLHPPGSQDECTWCNGSFKRPNAQFGRGERVHHVSCPHCNLPT